MSPCSRDGGNSAKGPRGKLRTRALAPPNPLLATRAFMLRFRRGETRNLTFRRNFAKLKTGERPYNITFPRAFPQQKKKALIPLEGPAGIVGRGSLTVSFVQSVNDRPGDFSFNEKHSKRLADSTCKDQQIIPGVSSRTISGLDNIRIRNFTGGKLLWCFHG